MRQFMIRQLVVGGALALMIAMTPVGVMAQATSLDPEARATVEALAKEIGHRVVPDLAAPANVVQVDDPPMPVPDPAQPAPVPEDGPLVLPELDLTALAEYSNQGVTIQVPADWFVDDEPSGEMVFNIEIPDTDFFLTLEADPALDFPSLLGVVLFRSQAEFLIGEFGEGAQLDESATVYTTQGLPAAKLVFSGEENGEAAAGAFYVLAPNENAYLFLSGGTQEAWAYAAEGVELIAQSITFDEELMTVVSAGDEPMFYADDAETVEVEVPAGWYAMDTGENPFPLILAEPEVRYVVAIGTESAFGDEFDPELFEIAMDELDPEEYEEVIAFLIEQLNSSGSNIFVDEDQSDVFPREGAVMVRLVGEADLGEGLSMPVIFYADIHSTEVGVVTVFGDIDLALAQEGEIMALAESVTGLE